MRRILGAALAIGAGAAGAQAVFDTRTQVLTVPTVQVEAEVFRDLRMRLDADGRVTILNLLPPLDPVTRAQAAAATAQSRVNACAAVQPFYWEIGDRTQRLAGGAVASATRPAVYDQGTVMNIASASKWLYGAYVVERRGGNVTAEDVAFLNFRSGYTNFPINGCDPPDTVGSCLARGTNGQLSPNTVGFFFYNGGHMQKHATLPGMALGALDNTALAAEMKRVLGSDIGITYTSPQLAGGVRMAARDYAVFLRKVLAGQLKIANLLGAYPVCTNSATCVTSLSSPSGNSVDWLYSLGHWVEAGATGDGAFSSPGLFGFYPWIDATRTSYGLIARADGLGQGFESSQCGQLLRKAWQTGVAQ